MIYYATPIGSVKNPQSAPHFRAQPEGWGTGRQSLPDNALAKYLRSCILDSENATRLSLVCAKIYDFEHFEHRKAKPFWLGSLLDFQT